MKRFVIILITCALLCSCNKENAVVGTDIPYQGQLILNTATKSSLASSSNHFSFELLHCLLEQRGEEDTESLLISPLSCAVELGVLAESGNFDEEKILTMLGFNTVSRDEICDYCHAVMYEIPALSQTTKYKMGNLLVVNSNEMEVTKDFQSNATEYYDTEVASLPFNKPDNVASFINKWAKQKTNGIITNVVKPLLISKDDYYLLSNALYFNGAWTYPFDKNNTSKSTFTLENGKRVSVNMMKLNDCVNINGLNSIRWNTCYSTISLPYGNHAFNMTNFLPNEGYTVLDVSEYLSRNGMIGEHGGAAPLQIQIPKFSINGSTDLKEAINTLSDNALPQSMTLYQVISMTNDEKGTEAAVVTQTGRLSAPAFPEEFIADHPFVFTISAGGIVLFAGVYKGD